MKVLKVSNILGLKKMKLGNLKKQVSSSKLQPEVLCPDEKD